MLVSGFTNCPCAERHSTSFRHDIFQLVRLQCTASFKQRKPCDCLFVIAICKMKFESFNICTLCIIDQAQGQDGWIYWPSSLFAFLGTS